MVEVVVTQADIDAANEICPRHLWNKGAHDAFVQAFARHRIAAETRLIDLARACQDQGLPIASLVQMMEEPNNG